jgi:hypothetical protein
MSGHIEGIKAKKDSNIHLSFFPFYPGKNTMGCRTELRKSAQFFSVMIFC